MKIKREIEDKKKCLKFELRSFASKWYHTSERVQNK